MKQIDRIVWFFNEIINKVLRKFNEVGEPLSEDFCYLKHMQILKYETMKKPFICKIKL